MKHIFIVAGHGKTWDGNIDVGAIGNGTTERQEVKEISAEAVEILKASFGSFNPYYEVHGIGINEDLSLREKIKKVNDFCLKNNILRENSVLISVHTNAFGNPDANGIETWHEEKDDESKRLASHINSNMSAYTGFNDRGIKDEKDNRHGRLGILADTIPVACLIECGFITNVNNARYLTDPTLDDKWALSIAHGLKAYFMGGFEVVENYRDNTTYDLDPNAWYYPFIIELVKDDLVTGYNDGTIRPAQKITRAEVFKLIAILNDRVKTLESKINS